MPLPGALIDIWQTNRAGLYDNQDPEQPLGNLRCREAKFSASGGELFAYISHGCLAHGVRENECMFWRTKTRPGPAVDNGSVLNRRGIR